MGAMQHRNKRRHPVLLAFSLVATACSQEPPPALVVDARSADPVVREYVEQVRPILASKCFACHNSEVEGPWYTSLPAPIDLGRSDIAWGRQRLDLARPVPFHSESSAIGRGAYLIALRTALLDDSMPPLGYLVLHPTTFVRKTQRDRIVAWTERALVALQPSSSADPGSYADVLSLVENRCARCHNDQVEGEMNGDFEDVADLEWLAEDGEYVNPGDLDASLLYERITSKEEPMPPSSNDNLTPAEIDSVRRWIEDGAKIE